MKYLYIYVFSLLGFINLAAQDLSITFTSPTKGENAGSERTYICKIKNNSDDCWVRISSSMYIKNISPQEALIQKGKTIDFGINIEYPLTSGNYPVSFYVQCKDEDDSWTNYRYETFWITSLNIAMTPPSGLRSSSITSNSFRIDWNAATGGNGGIKNYNLYLNGNLIKSGIQQKYYIVNNLSGNTIYTVYIKANDYGNNTSASSEAINITTLCINPEIIENNINYETDYNSVIQEATSYIHLQQGFRYKATGNNYYIARIVSCGSPSTRIMMLNKEEHEMISDDNNTAQITLHKNNFILYPNPTSDIINITMGDYVDQIENIQIYNMSGLLVYQRKPTMSTETFEMYKYPTGIYMINIRHSDGQNQTFKFIYK